MNLIKRLNVKNDYLLKLCADIYVRYILALKKNTGFKVRDSNYLEE